MANDEGDFLRDPRFPDRPQTEDFWRLSSVVTKMDGRAVEDQEELPALLADVCDPESLIYMATQRVNRLTGGPARLSPATRGTLIAIYIDAFTMGVEFQKEGGHR